MLSGRQDGGAARSLSFHADDRDDELEEGSERIGGDSEEEEENGRSRLVRSQRSWERQYGGDDPMMHAFAEQRKTELRVKGFHYVSLIANRLYFSRAYTVLYVFMILLNVVLLIWLVLNGTGQVTRGFLALETIVTCVLGIEVAARMLTQGKKYWERYSNWFEFVVLILCTITVVMARTTHTLTMSEEVDEMVSWTLLVLRYVLQAFRLLALLRHRKRILALNLSQNDYLDKARRSSSLGIIDFDSIDTEEDLAGDLEIFHETLDFDALMASNKGNGSYSFEEKSLELQKL